MRIKQWIGAGVFMVSSLSTLAASIEGLWSSSDDQTQEKRAIIQIYQKNQKYYAKIVQVFKKPGDLGYCHHCPGHFKDKPMIGLTFAWNLKLVAENRWGDGKILDPQSGKIYRAQWSLENSNQLMVRGYLGISLLGRTKVWTREE